MATYDLTDSEQVESLKLMIAEFQLHGKEVELKVLRKKRTLNQNNYLHLLLGYIGVERGYTIEEVKCLFKEMNHDIFYYMKDTKDGEDIHTFIRSTRDISKADMAKAIDRLHKVSAENGLQLPPATDKGWLNEIEKAIEQSNHYL